MIINIRGTGGSGKSHLVRAIMALYPKVESQFQEGRKQPISYLCSKKGSPSLFVPGHYETPCGGCDTITSPDEAYRLVRLAASVGHDVLYEGIIIGDDVTRCAALHLDKFPIRVIALNTPMEMCLASIQARRDARGDIRPLSSKNTVDRHERLKRIMSRLKLSNVDAQWMSRDEAFEAVRGEFHV